MEHVIGGPNKIGGSGGPNQKMQINVNIAQQPDVRCKECNGLYFREATRLKLISQLVAPSGKQELFPIKTFLCVDCGVELTEIHTALPGAVPPGAAPETPQPEQPESPQPEQKEGEPNG